MSSNRKVIVLVAVGSALLGVLATLLYQDTNGDAGGGKSLSRKADSWQPPKPQWVNPPRDSIAGKQEKPPIANPPRVAKAMRPNLENPPQVTQVREDTARDPHSTPQALLAFADELSVSMQGAFTDRDTRYAVSRQLIACARDVQARGSAQAARALCLYNLERLKERFPEELSPSYQSLLAELPEDLIFVAGVAKNSGDK